MEFLLERDSVEPRDKKQSARPSFALPSKKREDQTQHDANNDAGNDWKIERAVATFDADIARQAPEPAQLVGSKPEQQAYNSQENANADQHFAELCHG